MLMEKSGNLLFQTKPPLGITHRCSVVEEAPLYHCGEIVPLKDNRSAQTPQNSLFNGLQRDVLSQFRSYRRFLSPALALPAADCLRKIIKAFWNLVCFNHGFIVSRMAIYFHHQLYTAIGPIDMCVEVVDDH